MDVRDILNRIEDVKGGNGQWSGRCPAHHDKHSSLSISVGDNGRILLKCHAGCSVEDIAAAMGLSVKDLFVDEARRDKPQLVATYTYPNGAQKLRYSDKSFRWRRPDGNGKWVWNRRDIPRSLYIAGELAPSMFVCEGEKDADNLHKLGYNAASGENGAGPGKWHEEYTEQLRGRSVCIFQDNDDVGKAYAQETAAALHGEAASVRVLDLSTVWPEIPEHGDVSDMIAKLGTIKARELIAELVNTTPEWTEAPAEEDAFLSCFKTLSDFDEEEATWLVPGWIPDGQITLMAADGGIGKTTLWCNLIAAISSGRRCILDPPEHTRPAQKVAFLTTEDSVRKKLRKKLRLAGANMENIITPDFLADKAGALRGLKFGTHEMERFIRYFHPALCVFDPVQGFIPPDINMGSRNAMRDCMAPLISLGEETGTTFLVVCHTNKRKGASGRDRIADSADLWDVSRSVLMAGYTEDQGIRYLSNEKNNYAELQQTLLFTINQDGQAQAEGTSWKRDREYTQEAIVNTSAPKREDCKGFIVDRLTAAGGTMETDDLDNAAKAAGYSFSTIKRAKKDLKAEGKTRSDQAGWGAEKKWYIKLVSDRFVEIEDDPDMPL